MHFIVDEGLSHKAWESLEGYFRPYFPDHTWYFLNGQPGIRGISDTELFDFMNTLEGDKILITQDRGKKRKDMRELLLKHTHIHCITIADHNGGFTPFMQIDRIRQVIQKELIDLERIKKPWRVYVTEKGKVQVRS